MKIAQVFSSKFVAAAVAVVFIMWTQSRTRAHWGHKCAYNIVVVRGMWGASGACPRVVSHTNTRELLSTAI